MEIKRKLTNVEEFLLNSINLENYNVRYCVQHGIFGKLIEEDDAVCPFCKNDCDLVENVKELKKIFNEEIN